MVVAGVDKDNESIYLNQATRKKLKITEKYIQENCPSMNSPARIKLTALSATAGRSTISILLLKFFLILLKEKKICFNVHYMTDIPQKPVTIDATTATRIFLLWYIFYSLAKSTTSLDYITP